MSIKESIDKIRKRVEDLLTDMQETRGSTRSLMKSARPRPLKTFLEKRVESLRPLKFLKRREEKSKE